MSSSEPPGSVSTQLRLTPSRSAAECRRTIKVDYTNWKGIVTNGRMIRPVALWFGATPWHPEPQWILTAWDIDKRAYRDFALTDLRISGARSNHGQLSQRCP